MYGTLWEIVIFRPVECGLEAPMFDQITDFSAEQEEVLIRNMLKLSDWLVTVMLCLFYG